MKTLIIVIIVILLVGGGYYLFMHSHSITQGQNVPASSQSTNTNQPGSNQNPRPSGMHGFGKGQFGNMPSGSKPIFGLVTAVSGNTLTIQRQSRNGSGTSITVDLSSATQFSGGSQSNIQNGTKIAGYGTANSDGSVNAQRITINPTFPTRGSSSNSGK